MSEDKKFGWFEFFGNKFADDLADDLHAVGWKAEAQATGRQIGDRLRSRAPRAKENGQIGERNTYPRSPDPRESKG